MPDIFTPKQRAVYNYDRDYQPIISVLHGAVRTGKTILNNYLWIKFVKSFEGQNKKFIMTGYTIPALKKNVLDEIEDTFGIDCKLNARNEFKLFGNLICCFGTDKQDSYKAMRGSTAQGWYGNEVTLSHKNSINEAFKRCSLDGFRIFWDTNPDSPKHHIKTNYIDKSGQLTKSGKIHIKAWHFELDDNIRSNGGFISDEYADHLKAITPTGMSYDRDILGLWVGAEGMIYKDYKPSKMVIAQLPVMKDYFAGVDWGYDHPGAIVVFGRDYDGNVYLVEAIKEREKDIDWWKKKQDELMLKYCLSTYDFYCDTARPEYVVKFSGSPAQKSVVEGITHVAKMMKKGKFFIFEPLQQMFEDEAYSYIWKPGGKEEPVKINDDLMDAIRYALYSIESLFATMTTRQGGG